MERSRRAFGTVDSRLQEPRAVFGSSVMHSSSVSPDRVPCGCVWKSVCRQADFGPAASLVVGRGQCAAASSRS